MNRSIERVAQSNGVQGVRDLGDIDAELRLLNVERQAISQCGGQTFTAVGDRLLVDMRISPEKTMPKIINTFAAIERFEWKRNLA